MTALNHILIAIAYTLVAAVIAVLVPQNYPKFGANAGAVLGAEAIEGSHTRMPDNIASLMVGVEEFLDFSAEAGEIAEAEHSELRTSAWGTLSEQANMQVSQVVGTDSASRFVSLISAAVSAKNANIEGTNGGPPKDATTLGWVQRGSHE